MKPVLRVVWFKRDLRTQDHRPLEQALLRTRQQNAGGAVLCLYIHEPSALRAPELAKQHSAFLRECLDDLRLQLSQWGGELLEVVGESAEVFARLKAHADASGRALSIWSHQETTTIREFDRDRAVQAWCNAHAVRHCEFAQNAVVRGRANRVPGFHHAQAFEAHLKEACQQPLVVIDAKDSRNPDGSSAWAVLPWANPDPQEIPQGVGEDAPHRIRGGRSQALKRLAIFTEFDRLADYPRFISTPINAEDGCSRLSPHLSLGTVSDREVVRWVNDAANRADAQLPPGRAQWVQKASAFFAQRLYWRSGYLQMMESHPEFEEGGDVETLIGLREPHFDGHRFERWATGHTGFPMVDASMRMLHQTGWINMRMRGMLASFALNELWLPPKEVGQHLGRLFLDYEPAIHWGQIHIHAGLLHGSRPLVYNPIKQAQDQDPEGKFVKKWVPELAGVSVQHIAQPWLMSAEEQAVSSCRIGSSYPWPMVDFKMASKCAKDRVYAIREGRPDPGGLPFEMALEKFDQRTEPSRKDPVSRSQLSLF